MKKTEILTEMNKRQTNWNLLDYLLLITTFVGAAQQSTGLWLATRQASVMGGSANVLVGTVLGVSIIALALLVLMLRRFDGLLERLVGVACVWATWYFITSIATFCSMLQMGQQAVQ